MADPATVMSKRGRAWSASFPALALALLGGCTEPITAPPEPEPPGKLHVHVTTIGSVIDGDGYWFRARDTTDFLQPNDDFTVTGMDPGPIEVELGNVASNCALTGDSILQLEILPEETTTAEYAVRCEAPDVLLVGLLRMSGPEPDPDGVSVSIDGEFAFDLLFDGHDLGKLVRPGRHELEVGDIRSNCSLEGPNPRSIYLEMGSSPLRPVVFEIITLDCVDAPGALEVSVATSGRSIDSGGYGLALDGVSEAQLGPDDTILLEDVTSDSVGLELTGVAANCGVLGGARRTVRVPAVDTLSTHFEVVCGAGFALRYEDEERATLDGPAPELGPEWTIELWARVTPNSGTARLLTQDRVIFIDVSPRDDGSYRVGALVTLEDGRQVGGSGCSVPAGQWSHYAVTQVSGLGRLYANGVLCIDWSYDEEIAAAPENPLVLGPAMGVASDPATFLVDELRIWREARTRDELRVSWGQLLSPGTSNLDGYWRFDDGAGQLVPDETGRFGDFVLGTTMETDAADPGWVAPGRP